VQGSEQAAGRAFSARMVELALSSYPGLYTLGPPQAGSAFGVNTPTYSYAYHDATVDGLTELTKLTGPFPRSV
jgi:hypothetical protein